MFSVNTATCSNLSHWLFGNVGSQPYSTDMKWFLTVCIALSAAMVRWLPLGAIWYFNPLESISSISSFENSLSIQCSTGLIPAFFSVLCISMNPASRCSFFLDLIATASIAPESLSSITMIYLFPRDDVFGNAPV